mmetsp:Transcript_53945/g.106441  ORF Transcript_53945/g.106441 Transcript_53945/m.106441 type:complete len:115 (+) Transcript_53945:58-402(+)|eukprot:CAMPEP_0170250466 /NCGR_PEP_ID=MMETSP0116_2-20130129/25048_1 /TAXON_ID=400756 /ORGANISM="Durinskia baltica, Strain CSIRO CS-38" /LENGTH=114 /DNA_ID=CAMNT_0010501399 /DNA_START=55 /DNA_END=399 /DNA_ORIENTATION=+
MGMKYAGAYLMAVLGGKESPNAGDIQKILESVEAEFDSSIAEKLVSELEGKTVHEVIAAGKDRLKAFGGGGGGGGVAVVASGGGGGGGVPAAEEKKAVVEEEEEDEGVDFDLFG